MRRPQLATRARRLQVTLDDPVVGWRYWSVSLRGSNVRLRSPFRNTLWPVGRPVAAECLGAGRSIGLEEPHDPPGDRCRCGIYGGTYRAVRAYLGSTFVTPVEPAVIGRAALWGDVLEEEAGWRGTYAYPDRLLVPTIVRDAYRIAEGLEAYGVPVVLLDAADTFATLQPTSYLRGSW